MNNLQVGSVEWVVALQKAAQNPDPEAEAELSRIMSDPSKSAEAFDRFCELVVKSKEEGK